MNFNGIPLLAPEKFDNCMLLVFRVDELINVFITYRSDKSTIMRDSDKIRRIWKTYVTSKDTKKLTPAKQAESMNGMGWVSILFQHPRHRYDQMPCVIDIYHTQFAFCMGYRDQSWDGMPRRDKSVGNQSSLIQMSITIFQKDFKEISGQTRLSWASQSHRENEGDDLFSYWVKQENWIH
jgi:hypothetical protein